MSIESEFHPLASDRPGQVVRVLRARLGEQIASGGDTSELRLDLGRALFAQGRHGEAVRELESLLSMPGLDPRRSAAAGAVLAGALVLSGRPNDGRRVADAVIESPAADVESEILARSAIRGLEFFAGRYEAALEQARRTVEIATASGAVARAEACLDLGGMLAHADEFDEAERWLALDADAPPRAKGEAAEHLGLIGLFRGRWEAVLDLTESADTSHDADRPDVSRVVRPALRAHALIHLDRVEQARRELATSLHTVAPPISLVAAALLAESESDALTAAADAERAIARTAEPRYRPQLRMWAIDLVRLALAAGDRATASWAVTAMEAAAGSTSVGSVHGTALAARGMLERNPEPLVEATRLLGEGPRVVTAAQAWEALAGIHDERAAPEHAAVALRTAVRLWQYTGAERDIRRVTRSLAAHGVRTAPASRPREAIGWAALSQTESTVAALIGEGLTNAQIAARLVISRRTAESHVAHVLAKLDVPTRAAAARVVAERRGRVGA